MTLVILYSLTSLINFTDDSEGNIPVMELKDRISEYRAKAGNKRTVPKSILFEVQQVFKNVFNIESSTSRNIRYMG